MKERLLETIKYYEKKQIYQEKRLKEKMDILANVLNKYDKGEVKYEVVEKADRDKIIYQDFLTRTNDILKDLKYILNGDTNQIKIIESE